MKENNNVVNVVNPGLAGLLVDQICWSTRTGSTGLASLAGDKVLTCTQTNLETHTHNFVQVHRHTHTHTLLSAE